MSDVLWWAPLLWVIVSSWAIGLVAGRIVERRRHGSAAAPPRAPRATQIRRDGKVYDVHYFCNHSDEGWLCALPDGHTGLHVQVPPGTTLRFQVQGSASAGLAVAHRPFRMGVHEQPNDFWTDDFPTVQTVRVPEPKEQK